MGPFGKTVEKYFYVIREITICQWAYERRSEESQEALDRDKTILAQNSSTPDLTHSQDASKEGVGKASTVQKQKSCSPNLTKQDKIMSQPEIPTQKFAQDDLMRLFRIMEEGAEMEDRMPHVSEILAAEDDKELSKALAYLEGSLKMSLNEIARSEESKLRLENALNILSSHCSEDGVPTIQYLQQEIPTLLSPAKQAYATIDTFNKIEQKEKLIIEERSKRKEAAIALVSEIHNNESSLAEAQLKEAELKEKISKFQAELYKQEREIKECETKLLSLKEQKKRSASDTMGFLKGFETVEKEKCDMVEENSKAKQQLQNMDAKWSSCLSNLKKNTALLGVHPQHKL